MVLHMRRSYRYQLPSAVTYTDAGANAHSDTNPTERLLSHYLGSVGLS